METARPTDVVVVGAGAIGVSIAYFLAKRGASVLVLEQADSAGSACSYGNAGLVCPSHCIPLVRAGTWRQLPRWLRRGGPIHVRPRMSRDLAAFGLAAIRSSRRAHLMRGLRALRDLSRMSRDLFEELTANGLQLGYRRDGLMNVSWTEDGFRAIEADARLLESEGFDAEVLTASEARAREPLLREEIAGAVFWAEDGHCEPSMYVGTMRQAAEALGAKFVFGEAVIALERGAEGLVSGVRTEPRTFRGAHVVVAAGAWSARCASWVGDRLLLEPGTGYHVQLSGETEALTLPLICNEHVFAATPLSSGTRLAGSLEFIGLDESASPGWASRLLRAARGYLDGLDGDITGSTWVGHRPCTPDSLPILGASPRCKNLVYATGHGMLGITLAPVTGLAISEMLTGEHSSIDISATSPSRML
jgi:D-amino-acid dehydrogenase